MYACVCTFSSCGTLEWIHSYIGTCIDVLCGYLSSYQAWAFAKISHRDVRSRVRACNDETCYKFGCFRVSFMNVVVVLGIQPSKICKGC